ncbi:alpha-1,6-mannosyltransferase subunit [Coprinopsis marcescibilis]|uniref:Mannosyltransferase n=1 Tax=Coprinopsis marcescibilis TaxID=230819 RepID=A0A5C3L4I3_COPMA|nr:alpha-1,6-mannosyltransferase subunit [Coprinopsis marcescibilis]
MLRLDILIFVTAWLYVYLAPDTKVEESFNLHAIHDILMYGVGSKGLVNYDHFVFPGAVPRTFVGNVLLAWISKPVIYLAQKRGYLGTKLGLQVIVRLVLATLNAFTIHLIRKSMSKQFGLWAHYFFTLLACSQFHLPFWMGRTVPNMYALFLVTLASYFVLYRSPNEGMSIRGGALAVTLLTFATVVFRAEVVLILIPASIQLVLSCRLSVLNLIVVGSIAGVFSVATTVLVDSYFWNQRLLWPEFSSIYFNVIQGKSAEWGVSPPWAYFTSHVPKLLLTALPLSFVGAYVMPRLRRLVLLAWMYVVFLSFLGHKEWRFIVYVVPIFNIAAGQACTHLLPTYSTDPRMDTFRLRAAAVYGCIALNLAFTCFTAYVSIHNYPGGQAMRRFHDIYPPTTHVHVHISNLAAQTGATLFHQLNAPPYWPSLPPANDTLAWTYNKTEGLDMSYLLSRDSPFTHLIVEDRPSDQELEWEFWNVVEGIEALDRVTFHPFTLRKLFKKNDKGDGLVRRIADGEFSPVKIHKREKLWILERFE